MALIFPQGYGLGALGAAILLGWIAARKASARARKRAGSPPETALEPFGLCSLRMTPEGKIIASPRLARLLGTPSVPRNTPHLCQALDPESAALLCERLAHPSAAGGGEPFVLKTLAQSYLEFLPSGAPPADSFAFLVRDVTAPHRRHLLQQAGTDGVKAELRRLSMILNITRAPIWIRDASLNILYCNLTYARAVEGSVAETAAPGVPELYRHGRRLAQAARDARGEKLERAHLVIGGERKLFSLREVYVPEMDLTAGFAYDLSDLERAEQEIANYTSAQADLLESASSAIAVYGADARLQSFNQAFVRMWGLDEAWLGGRPKLGEVLEFLREKRRLPEQVNFQAYKQRQLQRFTDLFEPQEELLFLPDGRTFRSVTIPYRLGGILVTYEDVTDRLALERSYNTQVAVQRETLDNLHEGVVVFGEDGRLRLKNPVFLKLWRLHETDMPERVHIKEVMEKIRGMLLFDNWERYSRDFIAMAQSRALRAARMERIDGSVLEWSAVPLPDGGTLLTFLDVSDSILVERSLREKNEALQAADKLKSEFLANVSYELRSPLTSITGFSEMLIADYFGGLNHKQREYIENINASSQHLRRLINDILDLASIEAGYMTLDIHEFGIRAMLESVLSLLSERIKEFRLRVRLECPPGIGAMKGDETRMRQVLFHLLSNAVKYSHEGGEVALGARRDETGIALWVQDEGVGIPPEEREAVFEKFRRGASGSGKSGTGLGLSLVRSFVALHGGEVQIMSGKGQGTRVTCFIPYARPDG